MYNIDDKPAAIKEVQLYLRGVGYDSLPVIVSGVFDDNTIRAVKDFQAKNNLSETGAVNYETFVSLYDEFKLTEDKRGIREKHDSFITFPVTRGMSGDEIEYANNLIIDILDYYGHYHRVRKSAFFSEATEEGVIIIQELFNLTQTGEIDEITYKRMLIERDSIFNFKT